MKSAACLLCAGALALAGCNPSATSSVDSATPVVPATPISVYQPSLPVAADPNARVVATVDGEPITFGELVTPLIKAHGLITLLQLVELDLARKEVAKEHLTVSQADIDREREITLSHLFQQTDDKIQGEIDAATAVHDAKRVKELQDELKIQHAILINQFLDNQHIAMSEFDTGVEINACLRKLAGPAVDKELTPDVVLRAFNEQYGQRVRVRYIQLPSIEQVAKAKERLKTEDFSDVAREMNEKPEARVMGGELPPFSAKDSNYPPSFRAAAFALNNVGEVSGMVEYKNAFYLIKLEEKLKVVGVKFEDVKDHLRAELAENLIQQAIKTLHEWLGTQAMAEMKITDPLMHQQFQDKQDEQAAEIHDQQRIKEEMDLEHHHLMGQLEPGTQPATGPATAPAGQPATQP